MVYGEFCAGRGMEGVGSIPMPWLGGRGGGGPANIGGNPGGGFIGN